MTARTRIQVAALSAAIVLSITAVSVVVAYLVGAPTERTEPESDQEPGWLWDLYGGDLR